MKFEIIEQERYFTHVITKAASGQQISQAQDIIQNQKEEFISGNGPDSGNPINSGQQIIVFFSPTYTNVSKRKLKKYNR